MLSTRPPWLTSLNGALLINKHPGISSFGIIDLLKRQLMNHEGLKANALPKLGHGGTLDPFATGLLVVCVGDAVKLARYFLGAKKSYEGTFRFGETTISGDSTNPITEVTQVVPQSLEQIRELAHKLTLQPYLQIPPMHSAKKKEGRPLYQLARQGIEIDREPKLCHLYCFEILSYEKPNARFRVSCSSGTYIRTLAQDFGRLLGSVALLETLSRSKLGEIPLERAWTIAQVEKAYLAGKRWNELPCWVEFNRLLDDYEKVDATKEEANALTQGQQSVLFNILKRAPSPSENHPSCLAIYHEEKLIAVARRCDSGNWGLERVFVNDL